jgi:hypothetical protein
MIIFDAAAREVCTVKRQSTNTPLQALVTLNDPTFSDSAVALAARETGKSGEDSEVLRNMWRRVQVRHPAAHELSILQSALKTHLKYYQSHHDLAVKRTASVESVPDAVRLAAFTELAEIVLNLDTTLNNY